MRWIVAVVTLAAGVWFLSDRQRRSRVQQTLRGAMSPDGKLPDVDAAATLSEMTSTARAKVAEVQETWPQTASRVADLTTSAGSAVVQKAQEIANAARQSTGDAAATVQGAAGIILDRAQQAVQATTGQPQETGSGQGGPATPEEQPSTIIGNKNTYVFHTATAGNLPAEENRVSFATVEEALAAGYRPAEREGLEGAGEQ